MVNDRQTRIRRKARKRRDLVRQGKSRIVSRSIWLFLTRKCPLACRHCCVCGSPEGESMSMERGLEMKHQELLIDVLEKDFGAERPGDRRDAVERLFDSDRLTYTMQSTGSVKALGRAAWALQSSELGPVDSSPICPARPFLHLNPNGFLYNIGYTGEVHYCPFYTSIPLGNICNGPMDRILRRARRDPALRLLNDSGDIVEFAVRYGGMPLAEAQGLLHLKGRCVLHQKALAHYYAGRPGERPVLHGVFERERERKGEPPGSDRSSSVTDPIGRTASR